MEDQSKASKKGMWSDGGGAHTIRDLKYTIENPRNFVDSLHQKPINGKEVGVGIQADSLESPRAKLGLRRGFPKWGPGTLDGLPGVSHQNV